MKNNNSTKLARKVKIAGIVGTILGTAGLSSCSSSCLAFGLKEFLLRPQYNELVDKYGEEGIASIDKSYNSSKYEKIISLKNIPHQEALDYVNKRDWLDNISFYTFWLGTGCLASSRALVSMKKNYLEEIKK